jgi:hypothetical protein
MTAAIQAQLEAHRAAPRRAKAPAGTSVPSGATGAVEAKKPRKASKHEEDALQRAVVTWFDLQYPEFGPLLFAVPNGGKRTQKTNPKTGKTWSPEATRLKQTGTRSGVADLVLLVPRPHILLLELKVKGGKLSDAQKAWLAAAAGLGHATAVAYDFNAARAAIVNHIGY